MQTRRNWAVLDMALKLHWSYNGTHFGQQPVDRTTTKNHLSTGSVIFFWDKTWHSMFEKNCFALCRWACHIVCMRMNANFIRDVHSFEMLSQICRIVEPCLHSIKSIVKEYSKLCSKCGVDTLHGCYSISIDSNAFLHATCSLERIKQNMIEHLHC